MSGMKTDTKVHDSKAISESFVQILNKYSYPRTDIPNPNIYSADIGLGNFLGYRKKIYLTILTQKEELAHCISYIYHGHRIR